MDSLDFWQTILRHEIGTLVLIFAVMVLLFGITYVCILRYLARANSPGSVEFNMVRESRQSQRLSNTVVSALFTLLSVVFCFSQFFSVSLLQVDVRQELPTASTTGTVQSSYSFFFFTSYININGDFYRCSSEVPDTWPEEGKTYEVTYLEHSKFITQLNEK